MPLHKIIVNRRELCISNPKTDQNRLREKKMKPIEKKKTNWEKNNWEVKKIANMPFEQQTIQRQLFSNQNGCLRFRISWKCIKTGMFVTC